MRLHRQAGLAHSFNGAALFQSGEPADDSAQGRATRASMGPLFFRAENSQMEPGAPSCHRAASMGPLFFRAENGPTQSRPRERLPASMGPHFFRAENANALLARFWVGLLQWGRSFSERRTDPGIQAKSEHCAASMGPLFFRAENIAAGLLGNRADSASMGPLFFRAENPRPLHCVVIHSVASMGPLFFRAENGMAVFTAYDTDQCFNGAALFQSGEHGLVEPQNLVNGASMGPLFFRAENRPPPKSLKDKGLQSGFREVRHSTSREPVVLWATGSNLLPKNGLRRASGPGVSDGTGPLESPGTSKSATVPTPRHNQSLGTGRPDSTKLPGGSQSGPLPRPATPRGFWPLVARLVLTAGVSPFATPTSGCAGRPMTDHSRPAARLADSRAVRRFVTAAARLA